MSREKDLGALNISKFTNNLTMDKEILIRGIGQIIEKIEEQKSDLEQIIGKIKEQKRNLESLYDDVQRLLVEPGNDYLDVVANDIAYAITDLECVINKLENI